MQSRIRSVLARGNGAVVVHRLLQDGFPGYRLQEIDPRVAALPPLYRLATRGAFADADIAHLAADYGPARLPPGCARLVTFHNFYIDDEHLVQADHIVVVSHFLADCVQRLQPRVPLTVIHNGIDISRFTPAPQRADRPLRVLFVGNPSRRKGFGLLAQVAARLPPGVELAYTAGLRNEQAPATGGLLPLGHVPYARMHELYHQADVLFFPSRREGFGLCVAEAMACGLPVVSSRCSAIPELVDEGRGGFLLPPDDVAGMAEALCRLLADAGMRAEMGAWNRARALRDFSLERMLGDYRRVFAALGS